MNPLRYLLHWPTWKKLPMLPRMYSVDYNPKEVDRDTEQLMKITRIRCPQGVKLLERRYHMTARELTIALTEQRRKRNFGRRIAAVVQRAYGLLPYDPMKMIARQHQRRGRR